MYSKDQASQLRQAFWTTFGQYLSPQLSADGMKINWVNYKTGIKHLCFKMEADGKKATIGIEISHPDRSIQELIFEQFKEFKNILTSCLNEEWNWELHTTDEYGKTVTKISTSLFGVSIFKREDWPKLIEFLKPRLIALDNFWTDARDSFDLFS